MARQNGYGKGLSKRVVVFEGDDPLLCLNSQYNEDGTFLSGQVENGGWDLKIKDGTFYVKLGRQVVNKRPANNITMVLIPFNVRGNYNEIIDWALTQERITHAVRTE